MAVQSALVQEAGTNQTWFGAEAFAGSRVVVLLGDRSGGVSATCSVGATALSLIHSLTTPSGGSDRRSLFLFEGTVPADVNPVLTSQVLDGTATPVAHPRIAVIVDEGASYTLVDVVSAHSGAATVTSQGTGSTAAAGGDLLIIAGETARGGTTVAWSTTSHTPANPGGGNWDLSATQGGNQNNARHASMGYASLTGQAAQAWQDTVTLGTARMVSALIAVWSAGGGGGEAHQGAGLACTVELTPGAGVGSTPAAGSGQTASVILTPSSGTGSPAVAELGDAVVVVLAPAGSSGSPAVATAGQPVGATLAPGLGAGTATVVGTGQLATVLLVPGPGAGAGVEPGSGSGPGQPAVVILTPGAGAGAPALVGAGLACTLILTPEVGTDVELVTPPERTLTVPAELRVLAVPAESRTLTVLAEVRRVDVPAGS